MRTRTATPARAVLFRTPKPPFSGTPTTVASALVRRQAFPVVWPQLLIRGLSSCGSADGERRRRRRACPYLSLRKCDGGHGRAPGRRARPAQGDRLNLGELALTLASPS